MRLLLRYILRMNHVSATRSKVFHSISIGTAAVDICCNTDRAALITGLCAGAAYTWVGSCSLPEARVRSNHSTDGFAKWQLRNYRHQSEEQIHWRTRTVHHLPQPSVPQSVHPSVCGSRNNKHLPKEAPERRSDGWKNTAFTGQTVHGARWFLGVSVALANSVKLCLINCHDKAGE